MKKILICLMLAILCVACSNYQVGNEKETYQVEHWLQYYKDVKGWDKMITIDRSNQYTHTTIIRMLFSTN